MGEPSLKKKTWEDEMYSAVASLMQEMIALGMVPDATHVKNTPQRVVQTYKDLFSGCPQTPEHILRTTTFRSPDNDNMIHVSDMSFNSVCSHHLLSFAGKVHFAYIPNGTIVGLSKIPRLVELFSHRPQVQEDLGNQIVDAFQKAIQPKGCAIQIRAIHLCSKLRGVKNPTSSMQTIALRGIFKEHRTQTEFLGACNSYDWSPLIG